MKETFYISSYITVATGQVFVNGQLGYSSTADSFATFVKEAVKNIQVDYPKFYKMDSLSKLAFAAAEYLLKDMPVEEDTAIILANRSGSLDTDYRHWGTIREEANYYPSPAIFVYTLANICTGELCIRHQFLAENAFFVADNYDSKSQHAYAEYLLLSGKAKRVLCGWVELFGEEYKAVLYLVEQTGVLPHTIEQIDQLFLI
ncbi:beta-ketoacyl-[acyl-carrier-protein] synthase family protein [Sphingobacterium yanglingense]|uniref:3-oxoacyl-ACP synthase n=1 Tax=Sphingobacterium yanglingense TaxID=1437280 RepID=A0A4R6WDG4_9SPHI|nr:hypothetical protein [Sphingobacterium yanglingense]TDQ75853.1 hypothetical protein CLV99_3547 [Sphingobacterium yanglingense]